MTKTYLTIPNTSINRDKVANTVAWHMINNCLTKREIEQLAADYLLDTYDEAGHSIGDLAKMVKETPIDETGCHVPQPQQALYYGMVDQTGVLHPMPEYYFFTRECSYEYNTLEVKEEVR
tara:strand:+ start:1024 stop:1383 length:360 start_codon:yes stop_codon:yes gene_type:complete